jgi:alpha-D-ribose 1-methylphosphonate 5-triphosphate synthase subunit PhnH
MTQAPIAIENQTAFRALMDCMARPGRIKTLGRVDAPSPLMVGSAVILRSLADYETPVWCDAMLAEPAITAWTRFQTGAPIVTEPQRAAFALFGNAADLPDFGDFSPGSEDYPDQSTTLIIQVERFSGAKFSLAGPGIRTEWALAAEPLAEDFAERWAANRTLFPRGIDAFLVADDRVVALPRTVTVQQRG